MLSHNHSIHNEKPKCKRPKKRKRKNIHKNIPISFTTQTDPSYLIWCGFIFAKMSVYVVHALMTIYSGFILIFILYRFFMIWLDEYEHIWCWGEQAVWLNELSDRQNAWVNSPTLSSIIKTRVHQIVMMRHDMNKKW